MATFDAYMLLDVVGAFAGSSRAPVGTVPACTCPDPVAPLAEVARGANTNFGPDVGIDVDALTDVPLDWSLCSGLRNLGNALGRRLRTVLGALASDPNYGFDLRDMLNAGVDASRLSALRGQVVAEIEKDQRVNAVSTIDFTYDGGTQALSIALSVETAVGPFDLIVPVTGAPAAPS
jgi:phage baseplate assembly protein W